MAELSQDSNMIAILNRPPPQDDLHSFTGSQFAGMSFDSFLLAKEKKIETIVGPRGYRYQGKFVNLSSQYRIGTRSLRIKARVDYGMNVDFGTIKNWQKTYHATYPGVKDYWIAAIQRAREFGFAITLGGRRFKIQYLNSDDDKLVWSSEQSAINHPIQGSGADMKQLAIAIIASLFSHFRFAWDLHDGIFYRLVNSPFALEQILEVRHALNHLPYKEAWGWEPSIPMLWDASVGPDWGSLKEVH